MQKARSSRRAQPAERSDAVLADEENASFASLIAAAWTPATGFGCGAAEAGTARRGQRRSAVGGSLDAEGFGIPSGLPLPFR